MTPLHFVWLELSIALPMLGATVLAFVRDPDRSRQIALIVSGLTLVSTTGAWQDFGSLHAQQAHDRWDIFESAFGVDLVFIDELNAPLLPLTALLFLLTQLATLRTKIRRFSFGLALTSEAVVLSTLTTRHPWTLISLLAIGTIIPFTELRRRRKPVRVYTFHMGTFVVLLIAGQFLVEQEEPDGLLRTLGIALLMLAVLLRNGVAPVHCWMTDLFEHASFGTSLLFVTPMVGAYGAMRLVLPIAPEWTLRAIALLSLATAIYAAGMTLVQKEARRFFTYLFLSQSSLVLVGLEIATPIGLTGALCVWLSVGLSLTGFGLTLRSVEARTGRLSFAQYHGLYDSIPMLAIFFLLTGLASIGFPGTIGFIGTELLVEGALDVSPWIGTFVVIAMALNGLAVLQAYFIVFTGARHTSSIDIQARPAELISIYALTFLILGGGLWPQPGVASRYHAAIELLAQRAEGDHARQSDTEQEEGDHVNGVEERLNNDVVIGKAIEE